MSFHTRSFSSQPQVGGASVNTVPGETEPQSFIRIHTDSQQSLDQLFNPQSQSSVPLRNRNLPRSFFNPSLKTDDTDAQTNGPNNNVHMNTNLHFRSSSQPTQRLNLHMRTQSTIAPMPRLLSNHSSNQSSQEFLNNTTNSIHNGNGLVNSANNVSSLNINNNHHQHANHHSNDHHNHHTHSNGWSSAANSTDDSAPSATWVAGQQQLSSVNISAQTDPHQSQLVPVSHHQQQQPLIPEVAPVQHNQILHGNGQSSLARPTNLHRGSISFDQSSINGPNYHMRTQTSVGLVAANTQQPMFYNAHATPVPVAHEAPNNHVCPTHSHFRSTSYHQRPEMRSGQGFHSRAHSTVAPTSGVTCSHQLSSHQSSEELLYTSNSINTSAATGWSSSGYSTDDMAAGGHGWVASHAQQPQSPTMDTSMMSPKPNISAHHLHHQSHHHHHHHIPSQTQQQAHQPHQQLFNQV